MEGTYPLPEAQLDRFALHLEVAYPDRGTLEHILERRTALAPALPPACLTPAEAIEVCTLSEQVVLGAHLRRFVAELLLATQPERATGDDERLAGDVRLGASPRAGLSLLRVARMKALLSGRFHVSREDLEELALPVLRHRVLLGFEARARRRTVAGLLPGWLEAARRASRD
jgi:MoxR-like ATPase